MAFTFDPNETNITAPQNLNQGSMPTTASTGIDPSAGGSISAAGNMIGGTPGSTISGAGAGVGLGSLLGIGTGPGALIGAGLGLVSGLLKSAAERRQRAGQIAQNQGAQNAAALAQNERSNSDILGSLLRKGI